MSGKFNNHTFSTVKSLKFVFELLAKRSIKSDKHLKLLTMKLLKVPFHSEIFLEIKW